MFKHRVLLGAGALAALGLWSGWAAQCGAQGTVPELRPVSGYTMGSIVRTALPRTCNAEAVLRVRFGHS